MASKKFTHPDNHKHLVEEMEKVKKMTIEDRIALARRHRQEQIQWYLVNETERERKMSEGNQHQRSSQINKPRNLQISVQSASPDLMDEKNNCSQFISKQLQHQQISIEEPKSPNTNAGNNFKKSRRTKRKKVDFQPTAVLFEAVARNDMNELRSLLLSGNYNKNATKENGYTLIHQCCVDRRLALINMLVKEFDASVHIGDNELWTPLHTTALIGYPDITKYLLENGADPLALNMDYNMPYDICDDSVTLDIIEQNMANKNITQEIIEKLRLEKEKNLLEIIKKKQNFNWRGDNGETLLHVAACYGYALVCEYLLDNGVNVNSIDDEKWTPLHCAAHWIHIKLLTDLVENGAFIDAENNYGETPVDLCRDEDIKQWIIERKNSTNNIVSNPLIKSHRKSTSKNKINNQNQYDSCVSLSDINIFSSCAKRRASVDKDMKTKNEKHDEFVSSIVSLDNQDSPEIKVRATEASKNVNNLHKNEKLNKINGSPKVKKVDDSVIMTCYNLSLENKNIATIGVNNYSLLKSILDAPARNNIEENDSTNNVGEKKKIQDFLQNNTNHEDGRVIKKYFESVINNNISRNRDMLYNQMNNYTMNDVVVVANKKHFDNSHSMNVSSPNYNGGVIKINNNNNNINQNNNNNINQNNNNNINQNNEQMEMFNAMNRYSKGKKLDDSTIKAGSTFGKYIPAFFANNLKQNVFTNTRAISVKSFKVQNTNDSNDIRKDRKSYRELSKKKLMQNRNELSSYINDDNSFISNGGMQKIKKDLTSYINDDNSFISNGGMEKIKKDLSEFKRSSSTNNINSHSIQNNTNFKNVASNSKLHRDDKFRKDLMGSHHELNDYPINKKKNEHRHKCIIS